MLGFFRDVSKLRSVLYFKKKGGLLMYDFFLSHSSKNKELAKIIYYTSLANGLSVWYDERYLKPGNHLRESIKRGIQESAGYLLLCSQEALESKWVPVEIELAKDKKSRDPNFVLTVVLLDDSQPPEWLMKYKYIKWNREDEPGSTLELISHLTGKEPVTTITRSEDDLFGIILATTTLTGAYL